MAYSIIGTSPDGKDSFLHSSGYYDRARAQNRIDTGDVKKHLMPQYKDYLFTIKEGK